MSFINTQFATMSELKAFAVENNISIEGDLRRKQSYVDSIESWLQETGYYDTDDSRSELDGHPSFARPRVLRFGVVDHAAVS